MIYSVTINGKPTFNWYCQFTRDNVIYEFDRAINVSNYNDDIDFGMLEETLTTRQRRYYTKQLKTGRLWEVTIKILKQWESKTGFSMFDTYCNAYSRRFKIQQVNEKYFLMYRSETKTPDITDCRKLVKNYCKLYRDQESRKITKPEPYVSNYTSLDLI